MYTNSTDIITPTTKCYNFCFRVIWLLKNLWKAKKNLCSYTYFFIYPHIYYYFCSLFFHSCRVVIPTSVISLKSEEFLSFLIGQECLLQSLIAFFLPKNSNIFSVFFMDSFTGYRILGSACCSANCSNDFWPLLLLFSSPNCCWDNLVIFFSILLVYILTWVIPLFIFYIYLSTLSIQTIFLLILSTHFPSFFEHVHNSSFGVLSVK